MLLLRKQEGEITHKYICLQTVEDWLAFTSVDAKRKANESVKFWMKFKSQTFRSTPANFCCHEFRGSAIAHILALKLEYGTEKETSLVDYCAMSDKLIAEFHALILKTIHKGDYFRVNDYGTGGPIGRDTLTEYDSVEPIDASIIEKDLFYKKKLSKVGE